MSSGMNSKRSCSGNYIYAELEIPRGKISGTCSLVATEKQSGRSSASCKIPSYYSKSISYNSECSEFSHYQSGTAEQRAWWAGNCPGPTSDSFELIFDNPTNIVVVLTTDVGTSGSSSANINLNFEEYTEPTLNVNRFENNACSQITVLESERLENDYDTLDECETQIIAEEPELPGEPAEEPEEPVDEEVPLWSKMLGWFAKYKLILSFFGMSFLLISGTIVYKRRMKR